VICYSPGFVARVIQWFGSCEIQWLFYVDRFIFPLQGFLNFIVYSVSVRIHKLLYIRRTVPQWVDGDSQASFSYSKILYNVQ
jgi:hypothetical protein